MKEHNSFLMFQTSFYLLDRFLLYFDQGVWIEKTMTGDTSGVLKCQLSDVHCATKIKNTLW